MSSNSYKITLLGKEYNCFGRFVFGDIFEIDITPLPVHIKYVPKRYNSKYKDTYSKIPWILFSKKTELEYNLLRLLFICKKTFEDQILELKRITEDQVQEIIKINDKEFLLNDNCYSNGNLKITVKPNLLTYDVNFVFHDIHYSNTCYKLFDLEKQLNKIYLTKVKPQINEYIKVLEKDIKAFEDEIESINELIGGYDIFL